MDLQKILVSVVIAAILGAFAWGREVDKKLVLLDVLSGDLDDVVDTMKMLHPPRGVERPTQLDVFFGSDGRSSKRRKTLERLRQQVETPPPGDDDASAARLET